MVFCKVKHHGGREFMLSVCRATRNTKAAGSYFPVILHKGQVHEEGPLIGLGGGIGGEGCAEAWSDSARQIIQFLFISNLFFSLCSVS